MTINTKSPLKQLGSSLTKSFCLGLLLVLGYAPFSLWWLPLIILPLWFTHIENLPVKQASLNGLAFGFGWFLSGISWVYVCIDRFGGTPVAVSILLMILLALYLALYPALACYLSSKLSSNRRLSLILFPAIWLGTELLRANLLTGFPWLSLGYTQIDSPLAQIAPIAGETGITFVILVLSVCLVNLIRQNNRKLMLICIASIGLVTLIANNIVWVSATNRTIDVALVQGNIKQELKWQQENQWPTMLKYLDLTRQSYDAQLIIWPESAVTGIEPLSTTQEFLDLANRSATLNQASIITGILNYNFESRESFNSLIVLGQKQPTDSEGSYYYNNNNRYYKNHLLPIGEFVPFEDILRPLAPLFNLPQSSFTRGNYIQPNLTAQGLNILPLICFEIAFPEQLAANYTKQTDILLTVSNDAWFGDSHGPHQHMEIARMRALEFGKPLLRATNTGITAIVNHHGQLQKVLPQFTEGVLKDQVIITSGSTPYSYIAQVLQWLLPLLLIPLSLLLARKYG